MWDQGYLDTHQMAGAFHILRSNDLIWSRIVHDYMLGGRKPVSDLMAWNADLTRMPYRMHSEYLRRLLLRNDFATGRYVVGDRPVWFGDIRVPSFAGGTVPDHVAPWRSVYKIHLQASRDVTFVLTSGGHNMSVDRYELAGKIALGLVGHLLDAAHQLSDALLFVQARLHLWPRWQDIDQHERQRVIRFLGLRRMG